MSKPNADCGCNVQVLEPKTGGPVERIEVVALHVEGMGCLNCARRVHNALVSADGVLFAHVDLATATATARIDPGRIRPDQLVRRIAEAGTASRHWYEARLLPSA